MINKRVKVKMGSDRLKMNELFNLNETKVNILSRSLRAKHILIILNNMEKQTHYFRCK